MPSPKKIDVTVRVISDSSKPGGVWFELDSNLISNGELVFENDKHPGFIIHYNIADPHQTGCRFQPVKANAMWVRTFSPGDPDPCPRSAMYWRQFAAISLNDDDKQLVVRNYNKGAQMFAYSLRFAKAGFPDPILFDPIGDNRNGPVQ